MGNTSGRTERVSLDANHLQKMYILIPICTYFEPGQPCPKLCEPPVEEGVQEVDVDDNIDQVERVAE